MALIPISSANFGGLVKGWKKAASGKQSWKVKEVREKSFDDEIGTIKYTLVPSTTYLSHSLMEINDPDLDGSFNLDKVSAMYAMPKKRNGELSALHSAIRLSIKRNYHRHHTFTICPQHIKQSSCWKREDRCDMVWCSFWRFYDYDNSVSPHSWV